MPRFLLVFLLSWLAVHGCLHFAFCAIDTAPWAWDEAYLLAVPARVLAAFHRDGLMAALQEWYGHSFSKSPLSMLGTLVPLCVLGEGPIGVRVDNLLVALLGAAGTADLLRRHVDVATAWVIGVCALMSPFAISLARTELADLYLWTATVFYLRALLRPEPLATARRALGLGGLFGVGMLAKFSFPLIAFGPSLVVFAAEMAAAARAGQSRKLLARSLLAGLAAAALFFAICGRSARAIWRHFRDQGGWVGDQYGGSVERFDLGFLRSHAADVATFLGWPWLVLGGFALALWVCRRREGHLPHRLVWALAAGIVVNFTYCYFHPVLDPRFTIGGVACAILLVGCTLGRGLQSTPRLRAPVLSLALALFGLVALANSFVVPAHPVLPVSWLRAPTVLPPPCRDADVRDAILDAVAARHGSCRVGLAGDHRSLNIENLSLRAQSRGERLDAVQIGYLGVGFDLDERLRRAGRIDFWVLVLPAEGAAPGLWTTTYARPVRQRLAEAPMDFAQLPFAATFTDGSTVELWQATR